MMKIGLDLAVRTCGLALMENNVLINWFNYESKEKDYLKLQVEMVSWIEDCLKNYGGFKDKELVIEGIFYGPNPDAITQAARIQGAVIQKYYEINKKFPLIPLATTARKYIGIDTWWSKAEIQLYVVDRFNLGQIEEETRSEIIRTNRNFTLNYKRLSDKKRKTKDKNIKEKISKELKDLSRTTKNAFNRLSTKVLKETGITSHVADAIILALYEENINE